MTDWKQLARALAPDATDDELTRTMAPLPRLEEELMRLASGLTPDMEPAITFTAVLEDSAG